MYVCLTSQLPEAQHRALYMAASGTDTQQIKYLLGIGADANWRHPKSGRTALHKAAKKGVAENIKVRQHAMFLCVVQILLLECSTHAIPL